MYEETDCHRESANGAGDAVLVLQRQFLPY